MKVFLCSEGTSDAMVDRAVNRTSAILESLGMHTEPRDGSISGPRQARGLQAGLGLSGFVAVVSGAIASAPFYVWLSILLAPLPMPFPAPWLVGLILPLAAIALGVWAWRNRKVPRLAAGIAIASGIPGLAIVPFMAVLTLVT